MSNKMVALQVRADLEMKRKVRLMAEFEGTTDSAIVRRAIVRDWHRTRKEYPEIAERTRQEAVHE